LEEFFPNKERYINELQRLIPVDPSVLIEYVNDGPNYTRPKSPDITYDFLENLDEATIVLGQLNFVKRTSFIIKREARGVLFQHPDSQLVYFINVPQNSYLDFSIALDSAVWEPGKGDGVEFIVSITKNAQQFRIFDQYIDPKNINADKNWFDFKLDLSTYSGEHVKLVFETKSGPNHNNRFDWAGWGEPLLKIEVKNDLREVDDG